MKALCWRLALLAFATNLHAQSPARWRLVEEWRVGGATEGPHFLLDVRAILALSDGKLVVVEGRDQQVHILGPRGQSVKTVGRRGAGPGEFRSASGAVIAPNGEIVVSDESRSARRFIGSGLPTIYAPIQCAA